MIGSVKSCLATCLLPILLSACGGDASPPPKTQEEASTPSSDRTDPVALCNAVQQSSDIPIGCTFQALRDQPTMVLRVSSESTLARSIDALTEHLIVPFCMAENAAGTNSGVLFVVATRARRVDCATGQLGDWVNLAAEERQQITVGQACDAISRSGRQVACDLTTLDGVPSMVVGFESDSNIGQSFASVIGDTAASFCQNATQADVRAQLVFLRDRTSASVFDCATGRASDWFPVRQQQRARTPASNPSPSAPSSPQARPASYAMVGNGGWELLRPR